MYILLLALCFHVANFYLSWPSLMALSIQSPLSNFPIFYWLPNTTSNYLVCEIPIAQAAEVT